MATMTERTGFTLIEMLIVITIIAVLAGLLIPGIAMAKRELGKVRCSNNLQQIGMGVEVMRQEKDDLFPGRLADLFDKNYAGPYEHGLEKLLLCPVDPSQPRKGTGGFNRVSTWSQFPELREDLSPPHARRVSDPPRPNATIKRVDCSYLYETSDQVLDPANAGDLELLEYLYRDEPMSIDPVTGLYAKVTWQTAKRVQVKHGNLIEGSNPLAFGTPFPTSFMPVLRCYWHHQWTLANARTDEKAINLSWDLNVFKSIPYWESTVNPDIPMPPP